MAFFTLLVVTGIFVISFAVFCAIVTPCCSNSETNSEFYENYEY